MKQVFCPRNRSHAPNPPVGWTRVSSITEARFTIQTWKRRPPLCDSTLHSKPLIHVIHSKSAHDVHALSHSSTQHLWWYALHNPIHKYSVWLMSYFRPTGHNPTTSPMLLHMCTAFFFFSLSPVRHAIVDCPYSRVCTCNALASSHIPFGTIFQSVDARCCIRSLCACMWDITFYHFYISTRYRLLAAQYNFVNRLSGLLAPWNFLCFMSIVDGQSPCDSQLSASFLGYLLSLLLPLHASFCRGEIKSITSWSAGKKPVKNHSVVIALRPLA